MKELQKKLTALKAEIKALAGKVDQTDEETTSMNEKMAEAEKLQGQIKALKAVDAIPDAEPEPEPVDELAALKAEIEALKVAGRRLDSSTDAPYVSKFADTWKYDNLDVGEHALMVGVLDAMQNQRGAERVSDASVKALALKIESEAAKGNASARASMETLGPMLKAKGIKAYEINASTYNLYGDQWAGVAYGRELWEKIRAETWVLDRLLSQGRVVNVPDGYESMNIPVEGTDLTWYKVAQTTAHDATSGYPVASITSSNIGTPALQSITLAKMGARGQYSGEMTEDSLIVFVPQLQRQLVAGGAEMLEHAVINGDTDTTATTNINDIGGTPAGTEVFTLCNGFRKLPLITNTDNARSAGTLTEEDYLETVLLMGGRGKNAAEKSKVTLIPCAAAYWKSLQLASVKTRDVWTNATLESGELRRIWGYEVRPSFWMHYDESGSVAGAYELLAQTDGKVDQDTDSDNTTGAILAVRWDQWAFAWKRRMTIEVTRFPASDSSQIVALARFGMTYRDTDAAAISYNVAI